MNFNRRDFLKVGLLSASALTFTACGRPVEHGIVSQYQMPEYKVLGQPSFWATTCTDLRSDCAVSVKTVENRAIQVIGTPGHFFSKGAPTSTAISTLNTLYHPNRIQKSTIAEDKVPGEEVAKAFSRASDAALIIVDRLHGTLGNVIVEVAQSVGAKIWVCDSHRSMQERRILKAVTGRAELPLLDLENRDLFVTVGANCLQENYAHTRTGWAYGRFRKTPGKLRGGMVSFSTRMNMTEANADVWMPVAPGTEPVVLGALGKLLSEKGKGSFPSWAAVTPEEAAERCGILDADRVTFAEHLEKLADRLAEAESPLVVGGFDGPNGAATVFLGHTITKMLNGDVTTFEPDRLVGSQKSGSDLFLEDGEVLSYLASAKAVLVHNVDVLYRFPWLKDDFNKVGKKIVLSVMPSETTEAADDVIPMRTWMEDWGDLLVSSPSGDWYGITQPAVKNQVPAAVSSLGFMLELAKAAGVDLGNDETAARLFLQGDREKGDWEAMLVRGGHWEQDPEITYPYRAAYPPPVTENAGETPDGYSIFTDLEPLQISELGPPPTEPLNFMLIPTHLGDGQLADRPWMQELPDAMTTVVWDSWIELNEQYASSLGVKRHDRVTVKVGDKTITGSAYPSPFIHPTAVGIPTGRGQNLKPIDQFVEIGWVSEGSNPKTLLDGSTGPGGFFVTTASRGVDVTKATGSKLLATFDERVYNLPRHILPE